ncbi:MAG TPA: hypothetical protein VN650_03775 [Gemmatimonadaceae bacterium]|nr:hypothetical protein [Gemmatimonadaceae bacterium]
MRHLDQFEKHEMARPNVERDASFVQPRAPSSWFGSLLANPPVNAFGGRER